MTPCPQARPKKTSINFIVPFFLLYINSLKLIQSVAVLRESVHHVELEEIAHVKNRESHRKHFCFRFSDAGAYLKSSYFFISITTSNITVTVSEGLKKRLRENILFTFIICFLFKCLS
jgi:hypothetical protein